MVSVTSDYEVKSNIGGIVGFDYAFTENLGANLEARYGDEKLGVTGALTWRF